MNTISPGHFWMHNSRLRTAKGQMPAMLNPKPRHPPMAPWPTNAATTTWTSTRTSTPSTLTTTPTAASLSARIVTRTCRWWGAATMMTTPCMSPVPPSRPTHGPVTDAEPTKVREVDLSVCDVVLWPWHKFLSGFRQSHNILLKLEVELLHWFHIRQEDRSWTSCKVAAFEVFGRLIWWGNTHSECLESWVQVTSFGLIYRIENERLLFPPK